MTRLAETTDVLKRCEARLSELRGVLREREQSLLTTKDAARKATRKAKRLAGAHALLTATLDVERDRIAKSVESVTTTALQAVFGKSMRFRFVVAAGAGGVSMTPEIGYREDVLSDGKIKKVTRWRSPQDVGGGVVDVAAFALRVVVLLLAVPKRPRVLVLDEPFKHVSDAHLPAVCELVKKLSVDLDVQFIIVSHEQELVDAADSIFTVSSNHGASEVIRRDKLDDPEGNDDEES